MEYRLQAGIGWIRLQTALRQDSELKSERKAKVLTC